MNKYLATAISGCVLLGLGVLWEIGAEYPDIFRNIVISIVFPPTYRILEITGIIVFLFGLYYHIQCSKGTDITE